jgi:hypothetical protein
MDGMINLRKIEWSDGYLEPESEYGLYRAEIVIELPCEVDPAELTVVDANDTNCEDFPFTAIR